jgi:hypothetical protein
VVSTIRPPCLATIASVTLRCSRSVRSSQPRLRPLSPTTCVRPGLAALAPCPQTPRWGEWYDRSGWSANTRGPKKSAADRGWNGDVIPAAVVYVDPQNS